MFFHARKPNYMTGFEELDHEFSTLEELLEAPQLKRFAEEKNFKQFSSTRGPSEVYPTTIMAEMLDGSYWCVGFTTEEFRGLPEWKK